MVKDYTIGDVFTIFVKYTWYGSPHKDFTVKVYSKHSKTSKIVDKSTGKQNQLYTDGTTEPSEFQYHKEERRKAVSADGADLLGSAGDFSQYSNVGDILKQGTGWSMFKP